MADVIQETQTVLLATVLMTACVAKLLVREPVHGPLTEVHGVPVPVELRWTAALRHSRPLTLALGAAEGGLGVALLITSHLSVRVAATLSFAAATWVVVELRNRRPDAGCGCFGGLSSKRVGRRSVARAALLTGAAIVSLGGTESGLHLLRADPGPVCLVAVLELALFAALSPELGSLLRMRHRAPVPCERRRSPLTESYATLRASDPWREHRRLLTDSEPLDVWREGCWRLVVFPARLDDQDVEIVFAVSTGERHRTVRVAVVEADWEPAPDDGFDDAGMHQLGVEATASGKPEGHSGGEDTGPNPHYATL